MQEGRMEARRERPPRFCVCVISPCNALNGMVA